MDRGPRQVPGGHDEHQRDLRECEGCHATIRWCRTTKGALMPVDPTPTLDGNVRLRQAAGSSGWLAEVMTKEQLAGYTGPRYTAHFATCSAAAECRRPRRGRGTPPGSGAR